MSEGKYWCYVEKRPGTFVRVEIDTSKPTPDGYFVTEGVSCRRQGRDRRGRPTAGKRIRLGRGAGLTMMRALVTLCVRHFGAVTALSVLALVLGCWGALRSPLDVFPEFVPSQVDIQTEAPGFAPQQVEELVTKQVENAVNGAAGLATLRSESIPGLSVVTITFADGIDVHIARQGISERLSELGSSLPAGVGTPKLSPLVSSTMDLLKIGLLVRQGRCLRAARRGGLDHQAAVAGGAGRGARHRVRRRTCGRSRFCPTCTSWLASASP